MCEAASRSRSAALSLIAASVAAVTGAPNSSAICDRAIAVLDTDRGGFADQATFYVELTRARDNVVLLTDDREALVEALETLPAEQMSALRAIGEQFAVSPEPAPPIPPAEKATVLDDAARENRSAAERFLDRVLSAAAASVGEREERAHHAAEGGTHVTRAVGYDEWRDGAFARSTAAAASSATPRPSGGISTAGPVRRMRSSGCRRGSRPDWRMTTPKSNAFSRSTRHRRKRGRGLATWAGWSYVAFAGEAAGQTPPLRPGQVAVCGTSTCRQPL